MASWARGSQAGRSGGGACRGATSARTSRIPELVTNADAAIAAPSRERGRIELSLAPPDAGLVRRWRDEARALGAPALTSWRMELSCADDGVGVNAATVDIRLGSLGELPESSGQRGLFGRGLRDVWLAQGGGRIEGIRDGRAVESWFFPAAGDDPYLYEHVLDEPAGPRQRQRLGLDRGSRVSVPLAGWRAQSAARLRTLVSDLVQIRPVLEDRSREVSLALPDQTTALIAYSPPEKDPERPVVLEEVLDLGQGLEARVNVFRAAEPIPMSPARALRRGGLVVRSGRAAHETTLVGYESRAGARHLYGEVRCDALEELQREALASPRPQVVVRVDRSGLNEHHPVVKRLYAELERMLRPLIADEERRAGAHLVRAGRELTARDRVGVRALNDALRVAFESPGGAGFASGEIASTRPPLEERAHTHDQVPPHDALERDPLLGAAMRFKRSPVRLHPGESRTISLVFDPAQLPTGTLVQIATDPGLTVSLPGNAVPEPQKRGWSRLSGWVRAKVSVDPGSRLFVLAEARGHTAELEILVVRHRASGWVREIARKDLDSPVEAEFDPETGVVTVYEGRREFRALERGARRAGLAKRRVREYLPYRMLEVEAAANAVYAWAAERVIERRFADNRIDPTEYASAVRLEAQVLRHRTHEKLMRAFLEPEVFEGGVHMRARRETTAAAPLIEL